MIMTSYKDITYSALVAEESDGTFTQKIQQRTLSDLPDNDVLIKVHYSSLNYKDALSASGKKGVTKNYPFTPGVDASGVVAESRDDRFTKGDEVIVTSYDLGMNTPGGFGQFISVPGDWIVPLPSGLTLKESMMIGTSGFTAAIGVEKIVKQAVGTADGELVVTGATGAVGSFAVGLLSQLGFRITAATGKMDQKDFLNKLGAEKIIHRNEITDVSSNPLLASRWIAALDTVGGEMLDAVIRQTAHNGVVTCCGNVLGHELHTNVFPFILRGISLMGIDSGITLMSDRLRIWNLLAKQWKPEFMDDIYREVSLPQLPAEIQKILNGQQVGKILVSLPD
jgi:acrylyl-CoA reductase (NADPH)